MHIIGAHSASPAPTQNLISDGTAACMYAELPSAFAAIDRALDQAGVGAGDWLAVDCFNSVTGAVTVLYLLETGRCAVLMPPPAPMAGGAVEQRAAPGFCAYRLTPEMPGEGAIESGHFRVMANPGFSGSPEPFAEPMLGLLTSGSTTTPKMAAHQRSRFIDNALNCTTRFALTARDRVAIPVPIFHMYGLGAALLPAIAAGASIDLQPGANVLTYVAREADFRSTVAFLTPAFLESLLQTRKTDRYLRLTVSAGDRLDAGIHAAYEQRFGPAINLYGSTELGAIAAGAPDDPDHRRRGTVGRPMPNVRLCADRSHRAVADGDPRIRGLAFQHPFGCLGYLGLDGVLDTRVVAGGRFCTQDFGRVHEDGYIEVLGRVDQQVKRDGRLVAFADVETALRALPEIGRVAVITSGRNRRGASLVACCEPAGPDALDERSVRRACRSRLPAYAVPDKVLTFAHLPELKSGKLDRQTLLRQYEDMHADPNRRETSPKVRH